MSDPVENTPFNIDVSTLHITGRWTKSGGSGMSDNDDELVRIARYLEQEHKDKKELEKESLKGAFAVILVCFIFACIFAFVVVNWIESL